jgi:hypothetical protein
MLFTVVNILHKRPDDEDYWQLHKHNCEGAASLAAEGYETREFESVDVVTAQSSWINFELKDMGYGPRDVHIMPCCLREASDENRDRSCTL